MDLNHEIILDHLTSHLKKKLKILVYCVSDVWAGTEQVAYYDILDLLKWGFEVRAVVFKDSPLENKLKSRKEKHLKIFSLNFIPRFYLDWRLRSNLHFHIAQGVNLIHTHYVSILFSIVPWIVGKKYKNVFLFESRHILIQSSLRNWLHRWIYQSFIYPRLDALIPMSQAVKNNILSAYRIQSNRAERVKMIPLGLDFKQFDSSQVHREEQRSEWGIDHKIQLIGLVGRITPEKGLARFIQAANQLVKNGSKKLKFVVVGQPSTPDDMHYLEEQKHKIRQLGLEKMVIFTGFQAPEKIPAIMRALDIVILPSKNEAFGLVAIEAMAMKCAVIMSHGGSADEIVGKEEEFCFKICLEGSLDLENKLRLMLDHPEKRMQMVERAWNHVRKNYDRQCRFIQTLQLYQEKLQAKFNFHQKE